MLQALIIVFREGFESFLTVAIIFAYLKKTQRDWLRPAVWWGIGAAVIASIGMGFWLRQVANQPLWEGVLALVAAVLVATFVIHIWRIAPTMKREMESRLEKHASKSDAPWAWIGVFAFTLLMITREGMETALLLIQVRQGNFWLGCAMGLALAVAMSWAWAHFGHRVNVKRFFQVTSLFLLLFTVQILFYAVHEFSEAELLPNSEAIHIATEPYSADGRYSLWIMFGMVAFCALWLAGATALDRMRANGRGAVEA
jgi:high-affinity iron transporter